MHFWHSPCLIDLKILFWRADSSFCFFVVFVWRICGQRLKFDVFQLAWLGYISDWMTAAQSLLLWHSYFVSAVDSQWNTACGRDVAGLDSPGEGNYPLWSLTDDMSLCDSFC